MQFKECVSLRLCTHPLKLGISLKMYFWHVLWLEMSGGQRFITSYQNKQQCWFYCGSYWKGRIRNSPGHCVHGCLWLYLVGNHNLLLEGWNVLLVVVCRVHYEAGPAACSLAQNQLLFALYSWHCTYNLKRV